MTRWTAPISSRWTLFARSRGYQYSEIRTHDDGGDRRLARRGDRPARPVSEPNRSCRHLTYYSARHPLPWWGGRQLCVMGKRAAVRSASTPCQLRVTSFASKSRLVDRHPLYVPASAAPHVRASHYGVRLAHDSKQYAHLPKITTDWQTRSAGDEELTTPLGPPSVPLVAARLAAAAFNKLSEAATPDYRPQDP